MIWIFLPCQNAAPRKPSICSWFLHCGDVMTRKGITEESKISNETYFYWDFYLQVQNLTAATASGGWIGRGVPQSHSHEAKFRWWFADQTTSNVWTSLSKHHVAHKTSGCSEDIKLLSQKVQRPRFTWQRFIASTQDRILRANQIAASVQAFQPGSYIQSCSILQIEKRVICLIL